MNSSECKEETVEQYRTALLLEVMISLFTNTNNKIECGMEKGYSFLCGPKRGHWQFCSFDITVYVPDESGVLCSIL